MSGDELLEDLRLVEDCTLDIIDVDVLNASRMLERVVIRDPLGLFFVELQPFC